MSGRAGSRREVPGWGDGAWRAARQIAAFDGLDDDHGPAAARAWRARIGGFGGWLDRGGRREGEQAAGALEVGLAGAAGEQAVVADAVADMQAQIAALLPKDFLVAFAWERLAHFPRYLKAVSIRVDKLRNNPARDAQSMAEWKALAQAWERELAAKRRAGVADAALEDFRWMLEELRVGLYAQELKTPMPVSVKRLQKIWDSRAR